MIIGLNIMFYVCMLIIPITCIIAGYILKTKPPKEINNVYGYRSRRSKASQEAWDFANVYSGKNIFIVGIVMLFAGPAVYLLLTKMAGAGMMPSMMMVMFLEIIVMIVVALVPTEMKLKEKFGN